MNEQQLQEVYQMVDGLTLSRSKKNINRDFSDGLLMAEVVHHYNPKLVSLHNYPASNSVHKKITNWNTLNTKVFKRIGIHLSKSEIEDLANSVPNIIECVLYQVLVRFQKPDEEGRLSVNARKMEKNRNTANNTNNNRLRSTQMEQDSLVSNQNQNQSIEADSIQEVNLSYNNHRGEERHTNQKDHVQTQELIELTRKVEQTYGQLLKLNELNKVKEEMVTNLEKKLEKILLS